MMIVIAILLGLILFAICPDLVIGLFSLAVTILAGVLFIGLILLMINS